MAHNRQACAISRRRELQITQDKNDPMTLPMAQIITLRVHYITLAGSACSISQRRTPESLFFASGAVQPSAI